MQLPFTREDFFDLLEAYNGALWPAALAFWVASVVAAAWLLSSPRPRDRWLSGLLAAQWAWSALAYHVAFFTRINPAAWLFAGLFLVQAALFFWLVSFQGRLSITSRRTTWSLIGWVLVVYALAYPAINALQHGSVLRIPTFALPCPTTILTGGLLLMASPRLRILAIVPMIGRRLADRQRFSWSQRRLCVAGDGVALAVFELQRPHHCTQ